jgi:hypothetical protein
VITLLSREANELSRASDDGASLWAAGDCDAATATELKQPFGTQYAEGAEDGVGVDAKDCGQVARRRQPFAGFRLAVGDRTSDLACYLLVQLGRLFAAELDSEHGASNSSFIVAPMEVAA